MSLAVDKAEDALLTTPTIFSPILLTEAITVATSRNIDSTLDLFSINNMNKPIFSYGTFNVTNEPSYLLTEMPLHSSAIRFAISIPIETVIIILVEVVTLY